LNPNANIDTLTTLFLNSYQHLECLLKVNYASIFSKKSFLDRFTYNIASQARAKDQELVDWISS
ncbi:MAG TPA: hypothetical protein ACN46M_10055, partial [Prochlorococcus sp.]